MNRKEKAEKYWADVMRISVQPMLRELLQYTRGEIYILGYLLKYGDVSPSRLAVASRTSTAYIAKALRSMENKGEIYRSQDSDDKQRTIVSITEKGKQRAEAAHKGALQCIECLAEKLGEEDFNELIRITSRIRQINI